MKYIYAVLCSTEIQINLIMLYKSTDKLYFTINRNKYAVFGFLCLFLCSAVKKKVKKEAKSKTHTHV